MSRITISRRTAALVPVLAVLAIPATAAATHLYTDVADGHTHEEGIQFVRDVGVTIGCQDGTVYCPEDPVTRAQMATFLMRLAKRITPVVAFVSGAGADVSTGTVVQTDIDVPADGVLVIHGVLDLFTSQTADSLGCSLTVNSTTVTGSNVALQLRSPENPEENCVIIGAQPVGPGTHTVTIDVSSLAVPNSGVGNASLTVEWIPDLP